jgi:hypothetical protein
MGLRAINLPYVCVAGEIGSVSRLLARVAKWQTRWVQVPVFVRTWGFKSPPQIPSYSETDFGLST